MQTRIILDQDRVKVEKTETLAVLSLESFFETMRSKSDVDLRFIPFFNPEIGGMSGYMVKRGIPSYMLSFPPRKYILDFDGTTFHVQLPYVTTIVSVNHQNNTLTDSCYMFMHMEPPVGNFTLCQPLTPNVYNTGRLCLGELVIPGDTVDEKIINFTSTVLSSSWNSDLAPESSSFSQFSHELDNDELFSNHSDFLSDNEDCCLYLEGLFKYEAACYNNPEAWKGLTLTPITTRSALFLHVGN